MGPGSGRTAIDGQPRAGRRERASDVARAIDASRPREQQSQRCSMRETPRRIRESGNSRNDPPASQALRIRLIACVDSI
jgi:hypothetical protein